MQEELRHYRKEIRSKIRIDDGHGFKLARHDPADTSGLPGGKTEAERLSTELVGWLSDLQEKLYAQDRWSLLLIFQAMDAAGKDGTIKHVMTGVNPQGVHVTSFKQPSAEELDHDFLWRCTRALPERGRIGIFNRSYYEEVLVVRVHSRILANQSLPDSLVTPAIWKERCEDIASFERHLARSGTIILKFFLNVSKDEQKERFLERLTDPKKHWKFSAGDIAERAHWDDYQAAYEDMIRRTSAPHAPWFVVPADKKWFTRLSVSMAILDALDGLGLAYPSSTAERLADIEAAYKALRAEED
jgi:PPK2 family polyphosphate:nucleotide phosphotransferase